MVTLRDLAAHYLPYGWFLAVWAAPLAVLCAAGVASTRGITTPRPVAATRAPQALGRTTANWLAVAALVVFVCAYVYLVFYHEELIGLDYAQLTARRFVDMPIWPESGRFFPLGLQEYNFLALLGTSAAVYHAFSVLELLVVLFCVFRILAPTPPWFRCLVILFLMTAPSFVSSFFGLVYPERDILFWLAVWIVCLQSFLRTNSRTALCGALVAAQFVLYYKETAFVFVGGFAGARLLLSGWHDFDLVRQRRYSRFLRNHALEIGHLILCAVFLLVYRVAITPHVTASYAINIGAAGAVVATLKGYMQSDLLLDVFAFAFAARLILLATAKRAADALWEPLAVGALAYVLAYVQLGMQREYYLAPADFVAALYLARLAQLAYGALRTERRLALAGAVLLFGWGVQQNVSNAASYILSRKTYVDGNVRLVSFLESYSRAHGRTELTLFFPQVGGFQLMEFSAFLHYKGLRSAGDAARDSSAGATFVVKNPHRFPGDLCQPSQAFRCVYAPTPQPNELVVFLPGRQPPQRALEALRSSTEELFHYRPESTTTERMLRALVPADRMTDDATNAYVFGY